MQYAEYVAHDAIGLADLIRAGQVSAREVRDAALTAIDRLNPRFNGVVDVYDDEPLSPHITGPLAGVPFLIKDNNIHVGGRRTTYASRLLGNNVVDEDSVLVEAWKKAGLSLLGRTNLCEFAANFVSSPIAHGPTRNPWDVALSPGGSSGGAAAAVASGMVPIAHGNDAGGSIRVPAACTGLFGFKPGNGRTTTFPHHAWVWEGLNAEHALTRSVRDSALALDIELMLPSTVYLAALEQPPGALRIGLAREAASGARASLEQLAAFETLSALLVDLGHVVVDAPLPPAADPGSAILDLIAFGVFELVEGHLSRSGRLRDGPLCELIEAANMELVKRGRGLSTEGLLSARRSVDLARLEMARHLREFDAIVTPAIATRPPPIDSCDADASPFDFEGFLSEIFAFAPFTAAFNASGHPAATLPVSEAEDGFPLSAQIVVNHQREDLLFRLCAQIEKANPWASRLAKLHASLD